LMEWRKCRAQVEKMGRETKTGSLMCPECEGTGFLQSRNYERDGRRVLQNPRWERCSFCIGDGKFPFKTLVALQVDQGMDELEWKIDDIDESAFLGLKFDVSASRWSTVEDVLVR